jgi:hypothetical protein
LGQLGWYDSSGFWITGGGSYFWHDLITHFDDLNDWAAWSLLFVCNQVDNLQSSWDKICTLFWVWFSGMRGVGHCMHEGSSKSRNNWRPWQGFGILRIRKVERCCYAHKFAISWDWNVVLD